MHTEKYPKIVFIVNIVIFTLLLLIGLGYILSITAFAESICSTSQTTSSENAATYDSVFPFLTSEAISTIMFPIISVISISFAMSTYLLNNSYNINNMSVSTNTRKLILNQSRTTSGLATILLTMLVPLLMTNIFKCYSFFLFFLLVTIGILIVVVKRFNKYNRERNIISNFDNNFKESKLKRRIKKEEKNQRKTANKHSDYILAFIEICYENKYQGMFNENLEYHQILNLWCESMDSKNYENHQIPKIEDKFESFYDILDDVFNNKQLDSKYISDLYVYFLSELEKVIFENAAKFKESNYEIMYSACLSYAFNSIFDVDVIDEFFKSKTSETFIYRWLFYRYVLLFEYNKFIEDTNFYKPRFNFSDELSSRVKSISPRIKDSQIIFLITSLYLYKSKCLKDVNPIIDMDNILEAMKEDLILYERRINTIIIKMKKSKRDSEFRFEGL